MTRFQAVQLPPMRSNNKPWLQADLSLRPALWKRIATLQAAALPELSKKRKAECCADETAEPETKRGKTLYETTIAAPFRRARRSLGCMQKVLQPIWGRATAQPLAVTPDHKTDVVHHLVLPSTAPASVAVAPAQTPQKGYLLRAASPLLEEMLESPVTACKPTQEAATGSPERHALYEDVLHSSHQQSSPSCVMSPKDRDAAVFMQGAGPSALGHAAGTERHKHSLPQSLDRQTKFSCSMSSDTTGPLEKAVAVVADTSSAPCQHGADAQADAAAVSSRSARHRNGAVAGGAAHCCSDAIACASSAMTSLDCPSSHEQSATGSKMVVTASRRHDGPVAEDRAHQDSAQQQSGSGSGLQVDEADAHVGASHAQPITAALLLQTPSSRRVSFTLPEGASCDGTERTPGKGFKRSPRRASPSKPHGFRYSPGKAGTPRFRSDLSHAYGMQSYSWSPLSRHTHAVPPQHRSTPTKCCSSFGSQQPKGVADVEVPDTEEQRGVEEAMNMGCEERAADRPEEGSVMVPEQEQGVGYVDIPRRVAWERLSSPGRKRHALQVVKNQIDPLQQDCREAFLNEKLAFNWKAGQAWAQLDLAGIHFTEDTCSQHHAEWKAAAERFIEKRGYMAAEQLRATLQSEWQQLKAIRKRCCTSVPEGLNGAGQSNLLPRTPKSIMKRKSPFVPRSEGAVMLTSTQN